MSDMTDNEIIKMLECCKQEIDSNGVICGGCKKCPNYEGETGLCKEDLPTVVLDLINRQKAEIERLKKIESNILNVMRENVAQTKAEAYKEFAERGATTLKPLCYNVDQYNLMAEALYNLLKEMVGDK